MTVNQFEIQATAPERGNVGWFDTNEGVLKLFVNGEWVPTGVSITGAKSIVVLTQDEYDELEEKDPNTVYITKE